MATKTTPKEEKVQVNVVTDKQARKQAAEAKDTKPRTRKAKATTTTKPLAKPATEKKADPKPPPKQEPKTKPTTPPGVSLKRGSTYVAGQLIAKHGLEAGCPKELVAELAAALGKDEKPQHGFDLRAAFHAIRGYLQAKGELPKELEAPAK